VRVWQGESWNMVGSPGRRREEGGCSIEYREKSESWPRQKPRSMLSSMGGRNSVMGSSTWACSVSDFRVGGRLEL